MNTENLISFTERTPEEQREIARQGGIASGEARRKKSTMLDTLSKLLDEEYVSKGKKTGKTYRDIATLGLIQGAAKGYGTNYKIIQELMEQKDGYI